MSNVINDVGKKFGRRIVTHCPICDNDSTYNINDIDKLIPMLKEIEAQAKLEVIDRVEDDLMCDKIINMSYFEKLRKELKGGQD